MFHHNRKSTINNPIKEDVYESECSQFVLFYILYYHPPSTHN